MVCFRSPSYNAVVCSCDCDA
uniref:Uncharacterized protein n=1 Tax=Anguilla anguilla TaxID=7936 RepID=A0A0E9UHN0_ANGAN